MPHPIHIHYTNNIIIGCRALVTSTKEGFAGTMLLHHPHYDTDLYNAGDKALRDACCPIDSEVDYCKNFFERRIVNNCAEYSPPGVGKCSIHHCVFFKGHCDHFTIYIYVGKYYSASEMTCKSMGEKYRIRI